MPRTTRERIRETFYFDLELSERLEDELARLSREMRKAGLGKLTKAEFHDLIIAKGFEHLDEIEDVLRGQTP